MPKLSKSILTLSLAALLCACAAETSPAQNTVAPETPSYTPDPVAGGVSQDGVTAWLGIRHASAERWALPTLNADWETAAPFDALGPACPQKGQSVMEEDCLSLNVFAPESALKDGGAPVLVWIHGGGFVQGEGGLGPASFARDGIVGVSFNYRLGRLGFRDWPGWDEGDPRNFGQADMVAALEWVRENIARFGGDPNRVTIMGHSAGGMGVQLMMVDNRADGLFAQAVAHSGYAAWPFPQAMNPSDELRMRIRYGRLEMTASPETLVGQVQHFHLPYIGGSDLPAQPLDMFKLGESGETPYLAGGNTHDGLGTLEGAGYSAQGLLNLYEGKDQLTLAYQDFADPQLRAEKLFGDMRYLYSTRETARAHQGPAALFLLDGPGNGRNHVEHYSELFGEGPSAYRDMLTAFIKDGTMPGAEGWTVLMPGDTPPDVSSDGAGDLDDRLDVLHGLTFPEPPR